MRLTKVSPQIELNVMVDGSILMSRFLMNGLVRVVFEAKGMPNVDFFYDTSQTTAEEMIEFPNNSVLRVIGTMEIKHVTVLYGPNAGLLRHYGQFTITQWEKIADGVGR